MDLGEQQERIDPGQVVARGRYQSIPTTWSYVRRLRKPLPVEIAVSVPDPVIALGAPDELAWLGPRAELQGTIGLLDLVGDRKAGWPRVVPTWSTPDRRPGDEPRDGGLAHGQRRRIHVESGAEAKAISVRGLSIVLLGASGLCVPAPPPLPEAASTTETSEGMNMTSTAQTAEDPAPSLRRYERVVDSIVDDGNKAPGPATGYFDSTTNSWAMAPSAD